MAEQRQLQKLTRDDVAKHNKNDDLVRISLFRCHSDCPEFHTPVQWVIIDSKVYDLTRFKNLHPGGAAVLLDDDIGSLSRRSLPTLVHFTTHIHRLLSRPRRDRRVLRSPSPRGH